MQRLITTIGALFLAPAVSAMPSVSGDTISWPADGWYQVQDAESYSSLCNGGDSCQVPSGTYIVINHSTGERFEGIEVNSSEPEPTDITVLNGTISWPDNGWYQVQETQNYTSVCEGTRSCKVDEGSYVVINHSTGIRYDVNVGKTTPVNETSDSPSGVRVLHYSESISELFWDAPDAISNIVNNEILRDGVSIGFTNGTSFYDDSRERGVAYDYEVVAINASGERSAPGTLGYTAEVQKLNTGNISIAQSYRDGQNVFISGDTAIFVADQENVQNGSGAVYVFTRNSDDAWQKTQRLIADNPVYAGNFGETLAIQNNDMAIIEDTGTRGEREGDFVQMYRRSPTGFWENTQTLTLGRDVDGIALKSDIALDGDTMMIGHSEAGALVFQRDEAGAWVEKSDLQNAFNAFPETTIDAKCGPGRLYGDLALNGDVALMGVLPSSNRTGCKDGAIAVFNRTDNDEWRLVQKIDVSPLRNRGGTVLEIDEESLFIVTRPSTVSEYQKNAAGDWVEVQSIITSDISNLVIAADSGQLLVGAMRDDGGSRRSGVAYLYAKQDSGEWIVTNTFSPQDTQSNYAFGQSVALDGDDAVIGATYSGVRDVPVSDSTVYYYLLQD